MRRIRLGNAPFTMALVGAMARTLPGQRLPQHHHRSGCAGFTLPELLVAGIIAALIVVMTVPFLISQLLEARRLELGQRIRENTSRLNYLIQIETSEASEIEPGVVPAECAGAAAGGFTLRIPRPTGVYGSDANRTAVYYFNEAGDIRRCGPPVSRNGVLLQDQTNTTGTVLTNAQLIIDPAGCPVSTDDVISYTVDFPDGNLRALGGCTAAHARSVFVCNPPTAGDIAKTDPADPGYDPAYVPPVGTCPIP